MFAKEEFLFSDRKLAIYLNLLWQLLIFCNPNYISRAPTQTQVSEKAIGNEVFSKGKLNQVDTFRMHTLGAVEGSEKTKQGDFEHFCQLIKQHCSEAMPNCVKIFQLGEVKKIAEYVKNS